MWLKNLSIWAWCYDVIRILLCLVGIVYFMVQSHQWVAKKMNIDNLTRMYDFVAFFEIPSRLNKLYTGTIKTASVQRNTSNTHIFFTLQNFRYSPEHFNWSFKQFPFPVLTSVFAFSSLKLKFLIAISKHNSIFLKLGMENCSRSLDLSHRNDIKPCTDWDFEELTFRKNYCEKSYFFGIFVVVRTSILCCFYCSISWFL